MVSSSQDSLHVCRNLSFQIKSYSRVLGVRSRHIFWLHHHLTYYSLPSDPTKSTSIPRAKHIHRTPTSPRDPIYSSINSKSPNLIYTPSTPSPRSYLLNHRNQIWVRLWVRCLLGHIPFQLWICETRKHIICFPNTRLGQDRYS